LLHLSDLHFGTKYATENQSLLDAELRGIVESVDRVVITGDLFDEPNPDYAAMFSTFKRNITHLAGGREPISITGNHDQRVIGLFGNHYEQVASIGPTKIVVDEQAQMVFICFNSSVSGWFARGEITAPQFKQVGAEYQTLTTAKPELKDFLPIVLVHHHPFSFDVPPETWVQRALSAVGLREETLLAMNDAEDLHRWCLDWKVKTILHGHKHKARYVEREVEHRQERMHLTAIGCGSSLGAKGSPLSYNLLEWAPESQRWVASFYESVNGGAFREVVASVSPANANRR
jgi:3',5'-cyclic AMP phosphodiesterase CpdA